MLFSDCEVDQSKLISVYQTWLKNNAGGIGAFKLNVKNITVTAVKNSMQCHVRILDTYLSHLPNDIPLSSQFYLRPLEYIGSYVWYSNLLLGFNNIQGMVKTMFQEAQIYQIHKSQLASD